MKKKWMCNPLFYGQDKLAQGGSSNPPNLFKRETRKALWVRSLKLYHRLLLQGIEPYYRD
jgi:hypothetical protein